MTDPRVTIAINLRTLETLFDELSEEALHHATDRLLPGGEAMVMIGPVADVEAFGYRQMSAMMGRTAKHTTEGLQRGDTEPPLSFLASWVDVIRQERDQPTALKATIGREVDYLRKSLDWMTGVDEDGEPNFIQVDDFANGLEDTVRAMENVLHAGDREEWARVTCINDDCAEKPRLMKVFADDASEDHHKCPSCHARYSYTEFVSAGKILAASEMADDSWVSIAHAAHSIDRPARTIRTWINDWKISTQVVGERPTSIYVLWCDIRAADRDARILEAKRKKARQIA